MSENLNDLDVLADRFDAFLIDQFGVLLDGDGAYPFAPATLNKLAAMGKSIILISNSGRRSEPNIDRLVASGFSRDSFETVLTSGEVAYHQLQSEIGKTIKPEAKVLLIARDENSPIAGLPLAVTQNPEDADLVLIAGSKGDVMKLEAYRKFLEVPASQGIRCLCTNPDITMLTPIGPRFGAGVIANLYRDMGAKVEWIGKPHPKIYQAASKLLSQHDHSKILCIGDSPDHDIKGGEQAGFATALVRTGIHANVSEAEISEIFRKLGVCPDFVLPRFSFSS